MKPATVVINFEDFNVFYQQPRVHAYVQNLARLALWTFENAKKISRTFDMGMYLRDEFGDDISTPTFKSGFSCGTTACYAGHGPEAGIHPGRYTDWNKYIEGELTGFCRDNKTVSNMGPVFEALFSDSFPNCPFQAVYRTQLLLQGYSLEHIVNQGSMEDLKQSRRLIPRLIDVEFLQQLIAGNFRITLES